MFVKECMTKRVELGTPEMTIREAAQKMRDGDFGILPIQKNDRLVGVLTDRDIAVRCVAEGNDSNKVHAGDVMTEKVLYCYDDQNLEEVVTNLGDNQVRRLPVMNRQKRLVGILALSDLARARVNPKKLEDSLSKICEHHKEESESFLY